VNFSQKLGPFYLLNDPHLHKQVKYILTKIISKDPHNNVVLQRFIEKYEKDKNLSRDANESLHLSDLN
jgi:hypothetical protein